MRALLTLAVVGLLAAPAAAETKSPFTERIPAPLRTAVAGCWTSTQMPGGKTLVIRNTRPSGLTANVELARPWRGKKRWTTPVQFEPTAKYLAVRLPAPNHGPIYVAFVVSGANLRATTWTRHRRVYRASSSFTMSPCPT